MVKIVPHIFLNRVPFDGASAAAVAIDPKAFRSGRDFSAWIGLVPKQHSSGGREKLGSISKQGDRYLRCLLTAGALAVIRYANPWHQTSALAHRIVGAAANEGCRDRARQ